MAETNLSENAIVQNILEGKTDFLTLDLSTAQDRNIALRCLDQKPLLSRRLSVSKAGHLEVLKMWIASKYENILILTNEQRSKELIDIYLEQKFKQQLVEWAQKKDPMEKFVSIIHSYTKQQLICYNYETKEGEAVSYFDEKLGIPVKLKTEASLKLKLVDALKLVKKIDIELERVDLSITIGLINSIIVDCLRATLLGLIAEQNISYYDIPKHFVEIRDLLADNLQAAFTKCGLALSDLKINDIYLTNNIDEQLEQQYFALAKIARVKEFEYKMEEQSLLLYEKKASIHANYPEFKVGMTEAEKDLALERYMKRIGKERKDEVVITEEVLPDRFDEKTDVVSTVSVPKPTAPTAPIPSKKSRVVYGILAAVWLVATAALAVFTETRMIGIIVGAVGLVALVGVGIALRYKLKYGISKAQKQDYERKLAEYNKAMEEYNQKDATTAPKRAPRVEKVEQPQPTITNED